MKKNTKELPKPLEARIVFDQEASYRQRQHKVVSPEDVHRLMASYFAVLDREHFVVLMLDASNHVLGFNTVSIGALNMSFAFPREVFKAAIIANAAGIVLMHNHPSGDPTPSGEDHILTARLVAAAKLLDIPIFDHVVFGSGGRWESIPTT